MKTTMPIFVSPVLNYSETDQIRQILAELAWDEEWDEARAARVQELAKEWIGKIRAGDSSSSDIETFLQNYPLASPEGRALMTLAEALLRIPDADTANVLVAEKIGVSDWKKIGGSGFFSAATRMGLGLAKSMLGGFFAGVSKPVIRKATEETVRRLGAQFVVGETIGDALQMAATESLSGYRMSFDMLGEGARTLADAERYYKSYVEAAHTIGDANDLTLPVERRHGLSIKLSALHPRYVWTQRESCIPVIVDRVMDICTIAARKGMTVTVDAEESERLELSLDIIARVVTRLRDTPETAAWTGFGLAIQAYERRAHATIDYICDLARASGMRLQIRLVKGAYWDGEIKRAQTAGWASYPVFTRKYHTDLSYLRGAQKMLAARDVITPMFATHNATTAAAILDMAGADKSGFEFQRLYGMGQILGRVLRDEAGVPVTCYAPVGSYEDLLPYLVRRMLENGANTSFVSQIRNADVAPDQLTRDVVAMARSGLDKAFSLPLPPALYGDHRVNSRGVDLSRFLNYRAFHDAIPPVFSPEAQISPAVSEAFSFAKNGFTTWGRMPADLRAQTLERAADLIEHHTGKMMRLLHSEAKKTVGDALAEIREAVDFCRYYASEGRRICGEDGQVLTGPTGERNTLFLRGRGVFVTISPWNFPLAIFLGQVAAALMAGNAVLAKPAEQTPKIADFMVSLLHQAGVPEDALICMHGDGTLGAELVAHPDVAGVAFTGSTEVAQVINRALAAKDGPIVPLIAETGGQNAMIVDSTALPEHVVDDVLVSAFGSAGQRCSALRVLYLQDEIADRVIALLQGAVPLLKMGAPDQIDTDIGPVIDQDAVDKLTAHISYLNGFATKIAEVPHPHAGDDGLIGTYFAPCVYEIDHLARLKGEVFGPILHVIRFSAEHVTDIVADINRAGYGLTFGIQSRLERRHAELAKAVKAGNIYINRTMIGAVVGVQPFGGQGLSGTGPKAGGPHYLPRFATEVTVTDNIMATGGNVDLLSLAVEIPE